MSYRPPTDDILFLLREVIDADAVLARPEFAHVDAETLEAAVRQAGRVASEIVAPVNAAADRIGARLENGVVRLPPGFVEAYEAFCAGGWPGLALPEEHGGQAMPEIAQAALSEMSNGASLAFSMLPVCGRAAARVLLAHAEPAIQSLWVPRLASGEWSGTIVMTEPHAGSDIGQARTRAVPVPDGSYALTGTKIFISFGDHDATPQNAHIVLARIAGAPDGRARPQPVPGPPGHGRGGRNARPAQRHRRLAHRGQDGHPRLAHLRDAARRRHRLPARRARARHPVHVHDDQHDAPRSRARRGGHRRRRARQGGALRFRAGAGRQRRGGDGDRRACRHPPQPAPDEGAHRRRARAVLRDSRAAGSRP